MCVCVRARVVGARARKRGEGGPSVSYPREAAAGGNKIPDDRGTAGAARATGGTVFTGLVIKFTFS